MTAPDSEALRPGVAASYALYLLARLPQISPPNRPLLARRFRFKRTALLVVACSGGTRCGPAHPSLRHIAAWISSVGAARALESAKDCASAQVPRALLSSGMAAILVAPDVFAAGVGIEGESESL
jgi:hypothetical protein